jgi:hypothetical protein
MKNEVTRYKENRTEPALLRELVEEIKERMITFGQQHWRKQRENTVILPPQCGRRLRRSRHKHLISAGEKLPNLVVKIMDLLGVAAGFWQASLVSLESGL